ncbi:hypothetical protein ACQ4PT_042209 [Festuca glaucescens]
MKTYCSAIGTGSSEEGARLLLECKPVVGFLVPFVLADEMEPRHECNLLRLLPFLRLDPEPIRSAKALKARYDEFVRWKMPRSQLRALNHKIVLQCHEWFNSKHLEESGKRLAEILGPKTEADNVKPVKKKKEKQVKVDVEDDRIVSELFHVPLVSVFGNSCRHDELITVSMTKTLEKFQRCGYA